MPALIVVAALAGLVGVGSTSQATEGVAFVGLGCLFAILARIRQAHVFHREIHPDPNPTQYAWRQQEENARRGAGPA